MPKNVKAPSPSVGFRDEIMRIVRFGYMGVLNVAINYAIYAGLVLLNVDSQIALLAGTVVSVAFAYLVGTRVVFGNRGFASLPRFAGVYVVMYFLNAGGLAAVERAGVAPLLAQLLLIPPIVTISYILQRMFVFGKA